MGLRGVRIMRNIKIKNYIYLLVIVSAFAWVSLALKENLDLTKLEDFFSLIPQVVTIDMLFIVIFIKWGWKLKFLRGWLVPYPNLNGSWIGHIYSDWKNPETGEGVDPIPVMLTIYQTFTHINCTMHTTEMKSYSISEGFNIDIEKQLKQLSYIYTSKPRTVLSERSNQHDGAMVFDILEKGDRKLKGHYWTDRKSKGEIILKYYSKEILEELPEEIRSHPVTEENHIRD